MNVPLAAFFKQKQAHVIEKEGTAITHHHFVFGDPAVRGEVLQHGHQELQTAVPVAQQQHHPDQVDYPHHGTGQVVGHVKDLSRGGGGGGRGGKRETGDGREREQRHRTVGGTTKSICGKTHYLSVD